MVFLVVFFVVLAATLVVDFVPTSVVAGPDAAIAAAVGVGEAVAAVAPVGATNRTETAPTDVLRAGASWPGWSARAWMKIEMPPSEEAVTVDAKSASSDGAIVPLDAPLSFAPAED